MACTYIRCAAERQMGRESTGTLIQAELPACGQQLLSRYGESVQTVYLDPPFNTGRRFDMKVRVGTQGHKTGSPALALPAYDDRWQSREQYLAMMRDVLTLSRQLLKKEGTIFLHIDSHMYAHLRLLMDDIFGENNFLNEIIWAYQTGGRARTYFPRKHDVILFYAKSRSYYFNIRAVPVARSETRSNHMRRAVDSDGRTYRSIMSGGREYRYYDDEPTYPGDVWDDISHLQQKDPQRTGFETQKPLKLLQRIVSCASQPGDLVCDLFAGSGTTAVAAAQLDRRFVCVDRSPLAISVAGKRLNQTMQDATFHFAYDVEAPCGPDDCRVEAEVFPAISSYTVRLIDFACDQAKEQGISGLDAVDQWSAGFVQGDIYRRCVSSSRSASSPALATALEMPVCAGEPCVMIVDIWGNRRFYLPRRRY
ncbi:MAG TPA: site-specific DNA-methyltransferase [Candidatus Ventricola gallistercoris]|nr:site-specific DNA-methyltransferase [Candidatus Ventricola gallistercoris]